MKYLALNLSVLFIVVVLVTALARQKLNKAMLHTLLAMLVLTAVFDSLLIKAGIVVYNTQNILNIYIWKAPIEDFAYTVAAVFLVSVIWEYYESKK